MDDWYTPPANEESVETSINQNGQYMQSGLSSGMNSYTSFGFEKPVDEAPTAEETFSSFDELEEPPLLEELGINFDHMYTKTLSVLNPRKQMDREILEDADWAGPILFCAVLGFFSMFTGKFQYGYIFGLGVIGCSLLYLVLNLLNAEGKGIDSYRVVSILGYALLPVVLLSPFTVITSLSEGLIGPIFSFGAIFWSTYTATQLKGI
eukprot:snap_masked-scaffold_14-processed-gene-10.24-mRNA-1 protein AED:0.07 eAED:0.10 QI:0/0/0/1/1/1/2/0/206